MAFEVSPNGSNSSITVSSEPSDQPGGALRAAPMQSFTDLADMRISLARKVRAESVAALNLILADTMTLRDLYKKHHWQTSGATFYELHLLFDKHHGEQDELVKHRHESSGMAHTSPPSNSTGGSCHHVRAAACPR